MKKPAQKKILLVEDEDFLRDVLNSVLVEVGFAVTIAPDGEAAQYILGLSTFDIVITDIKMPKKDGITLLKWIKKEKNLPVILMTGFSDLLETKTAEQLGADGFLPKPFKKEDLLEQVAHCISLYTKKEEEDSEKEKEKKKDPAEDSYCSLNIDEFIAGRQIAYDIFIKVGNKYIKIAYAGEDVPIERIRDYKKKGVQFLYLKYIDFQAYLRQSMQLTRALAGSKTIAKEKKINFLKHAGEVLHEKLYIADVDMETFNNAKDFMACTMEILSDHDDVVNMMNLLNQHGDFLYTHSMGVSLYSVMLAKKLGWHSSNTLYKLSMGGLLHDIEKKEIDRVILEKKRIELSQAELAIFETHPARGLELLGHMKGIPEDIPEIVYQHHEDCLGYGYPTKLTRAKIHPLAKVVAVANVFCTLTIKGPESSGMKGPEAVEQMIRFYKDVFDPKVMQALFDLYKVNPRTIIPAK